MGPAGGERRGLAARRARSSAPHTSGRRSHASSDAPRRTRFRATHRRTARVFSRELTTPASPMDSSMEDSTMRKLSLTLAVLALGLFAAHSASAQQRHIGFFGGVNLATLSVDVPTGDTEPETSSRVGPAVGLVGGLGLGTGNM